MAEWKFYGRKEQLADVERILLRKRWFFAKVTGRRRIGKTTLIQHATQDVGGEQPVFYVQIPDSEPAGVLCQATISLTTRDGSTPVSLKSSPCDLKVNRV
jgi:uncharacterized protein